METTTRSDDDLLGWPNEETRDLFAWLLSFKANKPLLLPLYLAQASGDQSAFIRIVTDALRGTGASGPNRLIGMLSEVDWGSLCGEFRDRGRTEWALLAVPEPQP